MNHLFRQGFSPTLWTGASTGTLVGTVESWGLAMEELATVQASPEIDLQGLATRMRRSGLAGGALVMVTGTPDESDLELFRVLGRDYLRTVVMSVAQKENEAILQLRRAGAITVLAGVGSSWAPVWREAMERAWSTATAG